MKIFHQPSDASCDAGRIDVMKRARVGINQSRPSTMRMICAGVFATKRRIRAAVASDGLGMTIGAVAVAT